MRWLFNLVLCELLALGLFAQGLTLNNPAWLGDRFSRAAAVGPTDFPNSYSGLVRWYKASDYDGDFNDGDSITSNWTDYSTAGVNAVPEVGNLPTYRTTQVPGGVSSIDYVDGAKHFQYTSLTTLSNFTFIGVLKIKAGSFNWLSDESGNWQVRNRGSGTTTEMSFFPAGNPEVKGTINTSISTNWHVEVFSRSNDVTTFYANGHQTNSTDLNTVLMRVGTAGPYDGGMAGCHMLEACIYATNLTPTQVLSLYTNYFRKLYTTIPGGLP